jgi:hypothetical protein
VASAAAAVFGIVLVLASAAKLHRPIAIAGASVRVLPAQWVRRHPHVVAQSGRVLAFFELGVAPAVALIPVAGTAIACGLGAVFVVAVVLAQHRGASCGCWGSLVPGHAGGAELARSAGLLGLAGVGLGLDLVGAGRAWDPATVALVVAFVAALVVLGHIGARWSDRGEPIEHGLVGVLLAVRRSAPAARQRPLWPWSNRRVVARWRDDVTIVGAINRLGPAAIGLRWDLMVVREDTEQRRGAVSNDAVSLTITEATRRDSPPRLRVTPLARPPRTVTAATS